MTARRFLLAILLIGPVIALAARSLAAAPQPTAAPDVLASLLAEVHELRLAMERSATVAPRVQLTLARLNIQEQRTVVLSTQLDRIREEQAHALLETKKLTGELEDVQKAVLQTTLDASQRRGYESEEQGLKRKLAQQAIIDDQLRTREAEAAQVLSAEQARWIDLNAKLDELERLLGPVR